MWLRGHNHQTGSVCIPHFVIYAFSMLTTEESTKIVLKTELILKKDYVEYLQKCQ